MSMAYPPLFAVMGASIGFAVGEVLTTLTTLPQALALLMAIVGGVVGFGLWWVSDLPTTSGYGGGL